MTPYELFDLAISTANRADVQWGLFITIHMAILGGIIYMDRPLTRPEKATLLVIYVGFAVINYLMTRTQLTFIHEANQEIAAFATDPCCADNQLVMRIVEQVEGPQFVIGMSVLLMLHLAMALLVFFAVIFDKSLTEYFKKPAN